MHPKQLQKQYGGEAKDCTKFWPPKEVCNEYGVDPDKLGDLPDEISKDNVVEESHLAKDPSHLNKKADVVVTGSGSKVYIICSNHWFIVNIEQVILNENSHNEQKKNRAENPFTQGGVMF